VHTRPGPTHGSGPRGARPAGRRGHAHRSASRHRRRDRATRALRHHRADGVSAGRGSPYRDDDPALRARGHAPRPRGARGRGTVPLSGVRRRFLPGGAEETVLDVASGTTIEEVLTGLGAARDTWLVAVNGAATDRDRVLCPGDLVDCFEPVAGG